MVNKREQKPLWRKFKLKSVYIFQQKQKLVKIRCHDASRKYRLSNCFRDTDKVTNFDKVFLRSPVL